MLQPNYEPNSHQVSAQGFNENQKMFKMQLKLEEQAVQQQRDAPLSARSPRLASEVESGRTTHRTPRMDGILDEAPSYLLKPFHRELRGDEPSQLQIKLLEVECLQNRRPCSDLDSQNSHRPAGLRQREADLVYGRDPHADVERQEPPERLMISSPNGQSECSGLYVL